MVSKKVANSQRYLSFKLSMTPQCPWKLIFVYDLAPWLSAVLDTAESKLSSVLDTTESKLSGEIDTAESILEFLRLSFPLKRQSSQIQARVNFTTQGLWGKSLKIRVAYRKFFVSEVSLTQLSRLWFEYICKFSSFMQKHCRVWTSGLGEDVWWKNQR